MRFIENAEVGMVHVNGPQSAARRSFPFGGSKGTSVGGREMSEQGLNFFTELKTAFINYGYGASGSRSRSSASCPNCLYLLHAPLLHLSDDATFLCLVIVGVPLIIGATYLFHLIAERPFMTAAGKPARTSRRRGIRPRWTAG